MLTIGALVEQICASRETAKPIIGVILDPTRWADVRCDRNMMMIVPPCAEKRQWNIAGVPVAVDWSAKQTVVFTDRASYADAIGRRSVETMPLG